MCSGESEWSGPRVPDEGYLRTDGWREKLFFSSPPTDMRVERLLWVLLHALCCAGEWCMLGLLNRVVLHSLYHVTLFVFDHKMSFHLKIEYKQRFYTQRLPGNGGVTGVFGCYRLAVAMACHTLCRASGPGSGPWPHQRAGQGPLALPSDQQFCQGGDSLCSVSSLYLKILFHFSHGKLILSHF